MLEIRYRELSPAMCEGRGWPDSDSPFGRLPSAVKNDLPDVWPLSHSSTGECCFFNTDAGDIFIRQELGGEMLGEPTFNVCAFSGIDLYVYDEDQRRWRWASATPYHGIESRHPEYPLLEGMERKMRRFLLYLPLRNRLLKMEIGVNPAACLEKVPPRRTPPVVYYGTSLIHGAYSSRAGLCVTSRIGRILNLPIINLGFSGAARMESAMAQLISSLDAAIYVIDPYHNLSMENIENNFEKFLDYLCKERPETPVLFLTSPAEFKCHLLESLRLFEEQKRPMIHEKMKRLMKHRTNLHFLDGRDLYGSDDVSIDGLHPNDEAFTKMAGTVAKNIRKILNIASQRNQL